MRVIAQRRHTAVREWNVRSGTIEKVMNEKKKGEGLTESEYILLY